MILLVIGIIVGYIISTTIAAIVVEAMDPGIMEEASVLHTLLAIGWPVTLMCLVCAAVVKGWGWVIKRGADVLRSKFAKPEEPELESDRPKKLKVT